MPKWMWSVLFAPALVVACGGEEEPEPCDAPPPMDVQVSVLHPDGATAIVDAASITLDGEPCENNGDGTYLCVAQPDGSWQLAVVDTRFTAYSVFLQLPEFACDGNDVYPHTAQLAGMMGS